MAREKTIDRHTLELFIEYEQLTASAFGRLMSSLGRCGEVASESYGNAQGYRGLSLPELTIETASTEHSINFTLGEGWLPSVTTDENHDIVVDVPKKLGIPLLCGYLLLTTARNLLQVDNARLDTQIKRVDLQLKRTKLQELRETRELPMRGVSELSQRIVHDIVDNQDLHSFVLYDIDILAFRRKEGDDIDTQRKP